MDLHAISLFSGVGMLDEGVAAALRIHGQNLRTVCYVEREIGAAGQLAALMEVGAIHQAPVWSDVATFDAGAWRGKVDCVIAGFPCQDLSISGKRAGLDGARSGLFFEVLRIARDCGANWLFLENVAGITSAGASVVDKTEVIERAASRVMGELADSGWDSEWGHVRASDVGASHRRERWFCLAWLADAESRYGRCEHEAAGARSGRAGFEGSGEILADSSGKGLEGAEQREPFVSRGGGRNHMDQLANFVAHSLPLAPAQSTGETLPEPMTASSRQLNPAFVCWLMGWPWWWTQRGLHSYAARETVLWRQQLDTHLQNLLRE